MENGKKLRKLLEEKNGILVAPGAYDAISAKMIEMCGFEAVYMTGYGQSASVLGKPDVGLITMSEMVSRVNALSSAVEIPLICDGDTGFGNEVNVIHTVRQYEKAGAAAIQLEDQAFPKKCGHMSGRKIVPLEEMVAKIKAAAAARESKDFHLLIRTDARTDHGIEEAIRRGKAYEEAGADILFIESPESEEEMRMIGSSFRVPVLANMVERGRTPLLPNARLAALGYNIVIYPATAFLSAGFAVREALMELKRAGTTEHILDKMYVFSEFNEFLGLERVRAIEKGDYSRLI